MKLRVNIEGMSCMHCVGHVKEALNELNLNVLEVSLSEKYALVEGEKPNKQDILNGIADAGYEVVSIEEV